jgi:hypothetical protein
MMQGSPLAMLIKGNHNAYHWLERIRERRTHRLQELSEPARPRSRWQRQPAADAGQVDELIHALRR